MVIQNLVSIICWVVQSDSVRDVTVAFDNASLLLPTMRKSDATNG